MQVFAIPRGHKQSQSHMRKSLPTIACAATYEPSTRMLALLFASPGEPVVKVGLYVFAQDFQRLDKATECTIETRADAFVCGQPVLLETARMPCVLLPAPPGGATTASAKVR